LVNIDHDEEVISAIYQYNHSSSKPLFSSTKIGIIFKPVYENKTIKEINFSYVEKSRSTSYKPTLSRYKMTNTFDSKGRIISNNYFFISKDGKLEEIMRNTYNYKNSITFTKKREVLDDFENIFRTDLITECWNYDKLQEYSETYYYNDTAFKWINKQSEYDCKKNILNSETIISGTEKCLKKTVYYYNNSGNGIFSKTLSNNTSRVILVNYNHGFINIYFKNSSYSATIKLKLYNTRGQIIFSSKKILQMNTKNIFFTQVLKPGSYLFLMEYNGQNIMEKIQVAN
jgi:hypothetical protein